MKEAEAKGTEDLNKLKLEEAELKKQEEEFKRKEEELKKKEKVFIENFNFFLLINLKLKLTPWNVDTISHDKFAKTIINKEEKRQDDENLTDEQKAERYVRKFFFYLKKF